MTTYMVVTVKLSRWGWETNYGIQHGDYGRLHKITNRGRMCKEMVCLADRKDYAVDTLKQHILNKAENELRKLSAIVALAKSQMP